MSGLGQLVSHLAARAIYNGNGATQMRGVEVAGGPILPHTAGTGTVYHLLDPGGWPRLPAEPDTFPWPDGPLRPARGQAEPATAGVQLAVTLAALPLAFAVWELK